jgi:protoheme IX farnesyltransferase
MFCAITGRDASGVAAVAATVAASQLAVGWHNDWLDAERDAFAGRRDKPVAAGYVSRRVVGISALVAAMGMVALAFLSGFPAALVGIVGMFSALAYNWPLKFTILSVLPYIISFAALPAFIVLGLPEAPTPPLWLLGGGAALGVGAHFANVIPDLDADARTGIQGLPHRLGATWSTVASAVFLAVASALLVFGPTGSPSSWALAGLGVTVAVLLTGVYAQWRVPASRCAFHAVIVAALINIALLLAAGAVV